MMRFGLKLSHKGLIIIAIPLIFELVLFAVLGYLLKQAEDELWKERHAKTVIAESLSLQKNLMDSAINLYLFGSTKEQVFLDNYDKLYQRIPELTKSLQILLRDSPYQQESLERVRRFSDNSYSVLGKVRRLVREGASPESLMNTRMELASTLKSLVLQLKQFARDQERIEQFDPQREAQSRLMVIQALVNAVWISTAIAIALAFFFYTGTIKNLNILMDNTVRLSKGENLNPQVKGGDEIAHLDRVFHDMADALEEAARRKQELVGMVSHDLKTPLTSVQASLTFLQSGRLGELTEKAQDQVNKAERSVSRLIDLINDLLDIEKMEAGKMQMNLADAVLTNIIDRSVEAVEELASKRKIKIETPEVDYNVRADRDRMVQVFVNLLSNAIKFSPDNSTIKIESFPVDNFIETRVIDQGRGIPAKFKDKIFQRFQQVEASDSQAHKGTGLGLPICKLIVEEHGGSLGVESEEGKGSTFWLRIPAVSNAKP